MQDVSYIKGRHMLFATLALVTISLVGNHMLQATPADEARAAAVAVERKHTNAIYAAREVVKAILREPRSAQFSNERFMPASGAVCGFVNAKNGFGGYAGRNSYVIVDGRVHYANIAAYNQWC